MIDPCKDALPGEYKRENPQDGWASLVLDAFRSQSEEESILDTLISNCQQAEQTSLFVTDFDRRLDAEINRCLNEQDDDGGILDLKKRQNLLTWYGEYLTRLLAISNGVSAFRIEIDIYVTAWREINAGENGGSEPINQHLANSLINLILPSFPDNSGQILRLLSVLAPRTRPILELASSPTIAYSAPANISVSGSLNGDLIEVVLTEAEGRHKELLRLGLDFPVLREALATTRQSQGITEYSEMSTPRIERFRASMIQSNSLSRKLVVLDNANKNSIVLS
jgi:hypothetical protein